MPLLFFCCSATNVTLGGVFGRPAAGENSTVTPPFPTHHFSVFFFVRRPSSWDDGIISLMTSLCWENVFLTLCRVCRNRILLYSLRTRNRIGHWKKCFSSCYLRYSIAKHATGRTNDISLQEFVNRGQIQFHSPHEQPFWTSPARGARTCRRKWK